MPGKILTAIWSRRPICRQVPVFLLQVSRVLTG